VSVAAADQRHHLQRIQHDAFIKARAGDSVEVGAQRFAARGRALNVALGLACGGRCRGADAIDFQFANLAI